MISISICDDDAGMCRQIEQIIRRQQHCFNETIQIELFDDGQSFLNAVKASGAYDLVFLDIEMPAQSGLAVAQSLRTATLGHRSEIVFISAKDGYDRQLFNYQPLNFIKKPVTEQQIIDAIQLAIKRKQRVNPSFSYTADGVIHRVALDQIIYLESMRRQVKIVSTTGVHVYYGKLADFVKSVDAAQFVSIHRSYIVNQLHIARYHYDRVEVASGDVLPISKANRAKVRARMLAVFEVGNE